MRSRRTALACAASLLFAAALAGQSIQSIPTNGTVLTVEAGGAARSTFTSRNDVYLAVGSPATPCQSFDLFADGSRCDPGREPLPNSWRLRTSPLSISGPLGWRMARLFASPEGRCASRDSTTGD